MRATLILTIASILTLAPIASAQDPDASVLTPQSGSYVGNEPNVPSQFCLEGIVDPSRCATDANGIDAALAGGDPVKILTVRWVDDGAFAEGTNRVLLAFGGDEFLVLPGGGNGGGFDAWYGEWSDLNGDGIIDRPDNSDGDDDIVLNADVTGGHAYCQNRAPTIGGDGQDVNLDGSNDVDDDEEEAGTIGAGPEADTGISHRCDSVTEFQGIPGKRVVVYVTPGDFNDWVNGPIGVEGGGTVTPGPSQPDFILGDVSNPDDTQSASDGHYVGPSAGFPQVWTDNGVLQTTLTEGIAEPDFTPSQARAYNALNGQVVDADVYKAVDPTAEALYAATAGSIWYSPTVAGINPDGGWAPLAQRNAVLTLLGPQVGPTVATLAPPFEQDFPDGYDLDDYSGDFGPYLNVFLNTAIQYEPGVALAADADSVYLEGSSYFGVYGHMGGWWDKNGDGWIGTANSDACGAHACGAVQDPNKYYTAKSNGEFFESAAYNNDGEHFYEFDVTLTPDSPGQAWGETGIYVLSDNWRQGSATVDPITYRDWNPENSRTGASNQYSFNPWDDIALQAACWARQQAAPDPACTRATSPTALVPSGPIVAHMVATTYSGTPFYTSYEHYILPGGNAGYDISVVTEGVWYDVLGNTVLVDSDVYPAV